MSEGMQSGGPTPELILETMNGHVRTAALRAAVELDVFTAVGEGCTDAAALAKRCGASERGIRTLANYLVVIGLLSKTDGHYSHTPSSAVFLDQRSPACMGKMLGFMHNPQFLAAFDDLATVVRQGHTALPGQGTVEDNHAIWVEFARGMVPLMGPMAPVVGEIVCDPHNGPLRVLDIAAGHGLFGIEVAKRNPEAHVTALDWSAVLEVARENARIAGVADRHATIAGSAFDTDFGGPFDAVLLTNFLHHFSPATCVGLLEKVRSALAPAGRAVTLEFVPNDDRVSPPFPAGFAMTMLATTVEGDAYTYPELDRMHRDAGFSRTEIHPVPRAPQMVVVGHLQ